MAKPDGTSQQFGRLKFFYSLPAISMAMLWTPLNVMQGIYIKHYGFTMTTLAVILLASRVYDAVADLAVGTVSDWLKARTARRKPLFAIGAVLFAVTAAFVYMPPDAVTPLYLAFWLFAFFTGYATVYVAHLAWGAELARATRQKTELFSFRVAAGYVGLCLFYALPLLPSFGSSEITPRTMQFAVLISLSLLGVSLLLALRLVPEGMANPMPRERSAVSLQAWRTIAGNRPFAALMVAYLLSGGGLGIWYGMIFIYVDIYLKKGALYAPLYLVAFGAGVLSAFVWNRLAARLGKKVAWSLGMALALVAAIATSFLTPTNADALWIGAVLLANTMGLVSFEVLPASILGDVSDYSLLKNGLNQTGSYFSLFMFATKVLFALGGAIGLALASWLGFDPRLAVQDAAGVQALSLVMSWLPAILLALSLPAILLIPMDQRRHAIVLKRLEQRSARESRARIEFPRIITRAVSSADSA